MVLSNFTETREVNRGAQSTCKTVSSMEKRVEFVTVVGFHFLVPAWACTGERVMLMTCTFLLGVPQNVYFQN